MAKVAAHAPEHSAHPLTAGVAQKPINLAVTAWHATIAGGAAVNETSGFSDPSSAEADRIPQLALAVGGTPGTYTIVGTWNSKAQTDTITTVANATVKGSKPFDTITSLTGPDPAANLDLQHGDSYASPPSRWVWTGPTGGNLECQLSGEGAVQVVATLPANTDWPRAVVRVSPDNTTIPTVEAFLVW